MPFKISKSLTVNCKRHPIFLFCFWGERGFLFAWLVGWLVLVPRD